MKMICEKCKGPITLVRRKPYLGTHYRKECNCGSSMAQRDEQPHNWFNKARKETS